jgi:hypothetical protein
MLTRRWMRTLPPERHGLAWRVANVVLFVLALVVALAVMVGVMFGIWALASQGS